MMVLFFHAARLAMVAFDPYLSSRPLADALLSVAAGATWSWTITTTPSPRSSSTPTATRLLLNGRFNNLVYGSYAPGAPDVFIDDAQWKDLWLGPQRYYLVADEAQRPRFERLVGKDAPVRGGRKRRQNGAHQPRSVRAQVLKLIRA